jgi:hypothetical protein
LALAKVEALKEVSNIGGAQWAQQWSECLGGNMKLSPLSQYTTPFSILYRCPT